MMEVIGLDNRIYRLKLSHHGPKNSPSSYHLRARCLLSKIYPSERILEEVHLPGCGVSLYVDFLLPQHKLAVEVQGEQHYSYIEFFHKNKLAYLAAKSRDVKKKQFFEINKIIFVELPYDRDDTDWYERITARLEAGCVAESSRPLRGRSGPTTSEKPDGFGSDQIT